jgi:hypothetical protein
MRGIRGRLRWHHNQGDPLPGGEHVHVGVRVLGAVSGEPNDPTLKLDLADG